MFRCLLFAYDTKQKNINELNKVTYLLTYILSCRPTTGPTHSDFCRRLRLQSLSRSCCLSTACNFRDKCFVVDNKRQIWVSSVWAVVSGGASAAPDVYTRRPVQSTSLYGPRPVSRHLDLFADENRFSTAAGGCPARRCIGKAPDRSIDVRRVGPIALHHTRLPERRQTDDDSNGRHFLLIDGRRRGSRTLKKIEV